MRETAVAERYAKALFLAIQDSKEISWEDAKRDLVQINQTIASNDRLRMDLANPLLPFVQKKNILRKKMAKEDSKAVNNFIDLLVAKKRMNLLPLIVARFEQAVEESQGILKATVKSAAALDGAAKKEIEKKLSALFKKKVFLEASVAPELLGGLVIKAGDTVIDNSLRSKLKNLKVALSWGHST